MENTENLGGNQSVLSPSSIPLSVHPYCMLPVHFFDLMLARQAREDSDEETETQVIELMKPRTRPNLPAA